MEEEKARLIRLIESATLDSSATASGNVVRAVNCNPAVIAQLTRVQAANLTKLLSVSYIRSVGRVELMEARAHAQVEFYNQVDLGVLYEALDVKTREFDDDACFQQLLGDVRNFERAEELHQEIAAVASVLH